jgi:hypothetical protein
MASEIPQPDDMPPELKARLEAELAPGERVVWLAQPRPGLVLRTAWLYVVIGLVWTVATTAFALNWMKSTGQFNRDWNAGPGVEHGFFEPKGRSVFDYLPWLFVLIGFGIMSAPFWMARQARRTGYALTDRRAIITEGGWFGGWKTSSYTAQGLGQMKRRERSDGSGDLIFEEIVSTSTDSQGRPTTQTHWRGFLNVDRVREVENLVRSTLLTGP